MGHIYTVHTRKKGKLQHWNRNGAIYTHWFLKLEPIWRTSYSSQCWSRNKLCWGFHNRRFNIGFGRICKNGRKKKPFKQTCDMLGSVDFFFSSEICWWEPQNNLFFFHSWLRNPKIDICQPCWFLFLLCSFCELCIFLNFVIVVVVVYGLQML